MGHRIEVTPQRSTDFQKMDSLFYLADQHGMAVLGFEFKNLRWHVNYFDRRLWTEPQRAFLPTEYLYEHAMHEYLQRCTVISEPYEGFQEMVLGEIDRLNKLTL